MRKLGFLAVVLAGWLLWSTSGVVSADVTPAEQSTVLTAHNTLRRSVAAAETRRLGQTVTIPDLTWNPTAASIAQTWANHLLAIDSLDHNAGRGNLGENLYMEEGSNPATSGDRAVALWAAEASSYTWDTDSCTSVCGHYTQIIWAATTSIGCGKATDGTRTYWACDYAPPGNISGQRPYEPSGAAAQPPAGQANPTTPGVQTSATVTYAAGWNIVAGPAGTVFTQARGSLYTLQPGDSGYETLAAGASVVAGRGYWAFFPSAATVAFTGSGTSSGTVSAPAGQWIMVGNPGASAPVTVRGADVVYLWDPVANQFTQTTLLPVGRGAWVFSNNGATITVGP